MFTGLIKDIGIVENIKQNSEGKEFVIKTQKLIPDINIDDSVATNGVCLTATKVQGKCFTVQAVHVTLEKTSLGRLKQGDKVNLQLALRASDRLGGHIVQGHVNGLGKLAAIKALGNNYELDFTADRSLFKYIIQEGSICIDGISLTVARLKGSRLTVSIIPHTYENTILHTKKIGDLVNIEVDMMAKYLENFVKFEKSEKNLLNLLESQMFNTIEEAILDIKNAKMVIVVDDEDRENEGDFIIPADLITKDHVNFMITEGRGLICAPLTEEIAKRLELPPMIAKA